MAFFSYLYIVAFLPITCLVFWWLQRRHLSTALWWLIVAAAVFYAHWNPRDILVAGASFAGNFVAARWILTTQRPRLALGLSIAANLVVLGYFKYSIFALGLVDPSLASGLRIALPLGISFFTFTQIAYLCDCHAGKVKLSQHNWRDYLTFVSFFPHLIAGPILHHANVIPQLGGSFRQDWRRKFATGLVLFSIGLFKKIIIADNLASIANPIFDAVEAGHGVSGTGAWAGAVAYALQIYFDFSGYSDLAVASALFLGFKIPFNFNSPYQAGSIIEFWRRWHITLSMFLRDYLYIPLGGNRRGEARRYVNVFVTMLLGGIWHGAGLTYIVWGALHGGFIVINHLWRDFAVPRMRPVANHPVSRLFGYGLTMMCVLIAWVFFRAASLDGAFAMLGDMLAPGAMVADSPLDGRAWLLLAAATLLAVRAPNSWLIHDRLMSDEGAGNRLTWGLIGVTAGAAFAVDFVSVSQNSPFLYFQF